MNYTGCFNRMGCKLQPIFFACTCCMRLYVLYALVCACTCCMLLYALVRAVCALYVFVCSCTCLCALVCACTCCMLLYALVRAVCALYVLVCACMVPIILHYTRYTILLILWILHPCPLLAALYRSYRASLILGNCKQM